MATRHTILHTVTTGVTGSAVSKLTRLAGSECSKLSLKDDIEFMRGELRGMHALLVKLGAADDGADGAGGHLDVQLRQWRDEVRRLSADIEAVVEDYNRRVAGGGDEGAAAARGGAAAAAFLKKSAHRVATVGARHSIGSRIAKLKARINEVNERRRRYNLDGMVIISR